MLFDQKDIPAAMRHFFVEELVPCGAPWVRKVEKVRKATRPVLHTKTAGFSDLEKGNRDPGRHITETKTVGWKQGCDCQSHDPIPCTVYDPFNGGASTGIAAMGLGRHYVGTEKSSQYIELSHRRISEWRRVQAGLPKEPEVIKDEDNIFLAGHDAA